jgi:hypothetical protein
MLLNGNGLDVFYIDESVRTPLFVATAIRVPFIRPYKAGWEIVWPDYLAAAEEWRRKLSRDHNIRFREELHAYKLLKPEGLYHKENRNLSHHEARELVIDALKGLEGVLQPASIITAYATDVSEFAGNKGMSACLLSLFQRLRMQANADRVKGMLFFDEGHDEYVSEYRRAQKYLPTGSNKGSWEDGKATQNLPLSMFVKDGNIKRSKFSLFIQIADLIAYVARLKLENEAGTLAAKRVGRGHHELYDALPRNIVNLRATSRRKDGIVPM